MNDLIQQRQELSDRWDDLDDGSFPGSKRAMAAKEAREALQAFDAAHPEVRQAMIDAKRTDRSNDYYA